MITKEIKMKEAFDRELRAAGNKFLLFYSAWDPFSVEFAPIFEKLAASDSGSFYKVSIETLPEAAAEFAVEVVPTVLFFRDGELDRRLDGKPEIGLTEESLAEFVWHCRGRVGQ